MHTLTATYRIVTPMFLGDADRNAMEIRPPSVKGALRFWWRALNWGRIRARCPSDASALQQLHTEEAELFGAAAEEGKPHGQARFILRVKYIKDKFSQDYNWDHRPGVQYLLGQGLWHFKNKLLRDFNAPGSLDMELRLKEVSGEQNQQLQSAMLALGLFGGLGSRTRRGLGSLAIQSLDDSKETPLSIPNNVGDLKRVVTGLSRQFPKDLPPISAFSSLTRFDLSTTGNDPLQLLNAIGEEFQLYRSWGKSNRQGMHKVGSRDAEQNFREDHDEIRIAASGSTPSRLPKRSVFGYPHNYYFSSDNAKVDIAPTGEGRGRRASPLFIHIHRFPDGTHAASQLILPANFMPLHDRVELKSRRSFQMNAPEVDWQVIHSYLNRFKQREEIIHAAG